jgi:hypothetical protein
MFGIPTFALKLLGGALALLAVLGFIYFSGYDAGKAKLRPELNQWKAAAHDYKAASRTWRARYSAEYKARASDYRKAVLAVSEAQSACSARVAVARKSEAAIWRLMARPVKVTPAGCPDPEIWRSDVLQASMRPGVQ